MSTTGYSSLSLAEAAVAIQGTQAYQAGRAEQFLNKLGKHACHRVHGFQSHLHDTHLSWQVTMP